MSRSSTSTAQALEPEGAAPVPVPFYFGPAERPLFGVFHAAQGPQVRGCGVLLCPPLGWEGIASYRAYRLLAERLSASGFAVLRFAYDGTGDSFGGDEDEGRVEAWLQSVELAAAELRARSGLRELALVGVHLGGTLAALCAERVGAKSLALWAPFVSGRAFLRQVKAYAALNPTATPLPEGEAEAAGFLFSVQTKMGLSALDLLELERAPAPRVLLLQRDETSPESKLAEAWRRQGAEVHLSSVEGYAAMMQEPRKSVVPTAAWAGVIAWLEDGHPLRAQHGEVPPVTPLSSAGAQAYEESCIQFGPPNQPLVGFLARPRAASGTRPAIILLNTASDHRVGPNRMYVPWARAFAARGFPTLRFDPTGVGDSAHLPGSDEPPHAYSNQRLHDVREALNHLATTGVARQFILLGLCSGAYVAYHVGVEDARVVGEVLINPQTFFWKEGDSLDLKVRGAFKSNRFYRGAVLRKETWKRVLRGRVNLRGIAAAMAMRVVKALRSRLARALPALGGELLRLERGFRATLRRGTRVLVVFSANDGGLDELENQLGPHGGRLQKQGGFEREVMEGPNHTFTGVMDQRRLLERLQRFLESFER